MSDYIVSLIRTIVPVLVGSVVGWFAAQGLDIDADATRDAVTGIAISLYYGLARYLEQKYPSFGMLLGMRKSPSYDARGPE